MAGLAVHRDLEICFEKKLYKVAAAHSFEPALVSGLETTAIPWCEPQDAEHHVGGCFAIKGVLEDDLVILLAEFFGPCG